MIETLPKPTVKLALIVITVPELVVNVNGFVLAGGPLFTVAELKTYCAPLMVWGLGKSTVQLVSAFKPRFTGVV